jgi:hypothetical protein
MLGNTYILVMQMTVYHYSLMYTTTFFPVSCLLGGLKLELQLFNEMKHKSLLRFHEKLLVVSIKC